MRKFILDTDNRDITETILLLDDYNTVTVNPIDLFIKALENYDEDLYCAIRRCFE